MKKSLSFLIIPTMLISSCALTSRCSALWDKLFQRNKEEPVTVDSIVEALEKLGTLDNLTIETTANFTGEDNTQISGTRIPTKSKVDLVYKTEMVGKNAKTISSYTSIETAKISVIKEALNYTNEEVISKLLETKYSSLQSEYSNSDVILDVEHDEVKFVSVMEGSESYSIYDEEAKQSFTWEADEDHLYYNTGEGGMGLIDTEDIVEAVKKGTLNGDTVTAVIDGEEIAIKVSISNGYVTRLEANVQENTHLTIEYSKFNETTLAIPEDVHKPECKWGHDGQTPFLYKKSEAGHRRYCQYCYKFLDEQETEHVHAHNDKGVCEICGYIPGAEDADSEIVSGFEYGADGYYLRAKVVDGIICDTSKNYNYDFYLYETDESGNDINYYVYLEENVIFVEKEGNSVKLDDTCLESTAYVYDIYRNLNHSTLETIKDTRDSEGYPYSSALGALKTYVASLTKNATLAGTKYELHHSYHSEDPVVIDACHKYSSTRCSECGALLSASIQTNHTATLSEEKITLDSCHKLVRRDCPVCHEHEEEIEVDHGTAEPRLEETVVDSCHKLVKGYCSACGDYLGKMVQENHVGSTKTVNITVNSCTTRTLTICTSCQCIVKDESVSDHEHVDHVICDYAQLAGYDFKERLGYVSQSSTFEFSYCQDCHNLTDNLVKEYPSYTSMDHPFTESGYTVHDISGEYDNTEYMSETFEHSLDEHDICHYCHAKVATLGEESLGFIAKYEYSWWQYWFYNKTTGEHIDLVDFDSTPESGYEDGLLYEIYTNASYPNISVRRNFDSNSDVDSLVISYGTDQSVTISRADFGYQA